MGTDEFPKISVIIPMKDEEQYIARCLESIIGQDYPSELVEVMVVDGGSNDKSPDIVKELSEKHSRIKLLGGPGVNCPAAMNIGIGIASGDLISKIDAHGFLASDYLKMSVKYLSADERIRCVGGPIEPVAEKGVQKANAIARSSIFGVGKGPYSTQQNGAFVNSVQCGTYKKGVFNEIGLFDESLQFGEDEEINWRIRRRGHKIFATPEIKFFYIVRNSFKGLFKQYYNYGVARVKVIQKHPDFRRVKHVVPMAFAFILFITGILALFSRVFTMVFAWTAMTYLLVSLTVSAAISSIKGWKYLPLLPISFACLHFGYGIGFAHGVISLLVDRFARKRQK
jgi:glycosyltransferase involved in cell wall biosynthesis